ncbi:MAG TPA: hypothetical protein DEB24_05045 [Coriobacteriia bacterium]|nr:hypothetical protein [Coriobacteriia bacterium]
MAKSKFTIKQSAKGYTFNLVAGNGEIIGTSEVYAAMAGLKNGVASVQKNAPIAAIEDQTVEGSKAGNPKFEIYKDKKGEFRFRLKAGSGQIILASQGYNDKAGCKNGVKSVQKNAPEATVE